MTKPRKRREYERIPGKGYVRVRHPTAHANAKPVTKFLLHGGGTRALRTDRFDGRSVVGQLYDDLLQRSSTWLRNLLGRDLTQQELDDADDIARLMLIKRFAWEAVKRALLSGDVSTRAAATAEFTRSRRELSALRDFYKTTAPLLRRQSRTSNQEILANLTTAELHLLIELFDRGERRSAGNNQGEPLLLEHKPEGEPNDGDST